MKTRYSPRVWAGFELLFRPWMARRLDGVRIRGIEDSRWIPDIPVLLVANHTSWWDGFLLREVHRRLRPDAPLHVVMTERELRRFPIFQWMGAVPLPPGPLGARTLLRDLESRLESRSDAVVGFFPQGRIWPSYRRPLGFRPGAAWLARRLAPLAVVPVGLHLQPLVRPAPAAFVSVGHPRIVRHAIDSAELEALVATELDAILAFAGRHGEAADRLWPAGRGRPFRHGGAAA